MATTDQIHAMAAHGNGKLITLGAEGHRAGDGLAATTATVVTCYLYAGIPYVGSAVPAHIFVEGLVYCDDYVDLGVLTVELYRGADRVANTTATYAFVSTIYAVAEYQSCTDGVYVGVVGATLARYSLTPPSISDTEVSYPIYLSCPSTPPPPPPAPLAVVSPGNQQSLDTASVRVQVRATGGIQPYTWSATGLPTGTSIDPGTGLISGVTTRDGSYLVTVTAADAAGTSATTQFTWAVKRDGCARCQTTPVAGQRQPYADVRADHDRSQCPTSTGAGIPVLDSPRLASRRR